MHNRLPLSDIRLLQVLSEYRDKYSSGYFNSSLRIETDDLGDDVLEDEFRNLIVEDDSVVKCTHVEKYLVIDRLQHIYDCATTDNCFTLTLSRGSNCRFNHIAQHYELKENYTVISWEDNRFFRIKAIVGKLLRYLKNDIKVYLHSLYYSVMGYYNVKNIEDAFSRDINHLCATCRGLRESLGIVVEGVGYFAGPMTFVAGDKEFSGLVESKFGAVLGEGVALPTSLAGLSDINIDKETTSIILLENFATFSDLCIRMFHVRFKVILIALKGQPDLITREFVHQITNAHPYLPVFALVDCDIGGFRILHGMKYGAENSSFMHKLSSCAKLQWMGLKPSDVDIYGLEVDLGSDIEMNHRDRKLVKSAIKQYESHLSESWLKELRLLEKSNFKKKLQSKDIYSEGNYLLYKLEDVHLWAETETGCTKYYIAPEVQAPAPAPVEVIKTETPTTETVAVVEAPAAATEAPPSEAAPAEVAAEVTEKAAEVPAETEAAVALEAKPEKEAEPEVKAEAETEPAVEKKEEETAPLISQL